VTYRVAANFLSAVPGFEEGFLDTISAEASVVKRTDWWRAANLSGIMGGVNYIWEEPLASGDFLEYDRADSVDYTASPVGATAGMGEAFLDAVTEFIVGFAKEFEKVSFKPVD